MCRPTVGPKEDNRTGMPFVCDYHEFTVVLQMRPAEKLMSYPMKSQLEMKLVWSILMLLICFLTRLYFLLRSVGCITSYKLHLQN